MSSELLAGNWKKQLERLFSEATSDVVVSSPFVTRTGIDFLVENLSEVICTEGELRFLTDLSPRNIVQNSTDPNALQLLRGSAAKVEIHHLPRLHAKVYVSDARRAIITSGNLTAGGLTLNYEYGISISDVGMAESIRNDVAEYSDLGVVVGEAELESYCRATEKVKTTLEADQKSKQDSARREFEKAFRDASDELIKLRLEGTSRNATFAKTILYLLKREGPLATEDLHPLIQKIHPDLCDDSIDRIIGEENYGKKWKHHVRAAQSTLEQRGEIELRDGKWKLK